MSSWLLGVMLVATAVVIAENGVRLRVRPTGMIRMMKAVLAMSQASPI